MTDDELIAEYIRTHGVTKCAFGAGQPESSRNPTKRAARKRGNRSSGRTLDFRRGKARIAKVENPS